MKALFLVLPKKSVRRSLFSLDSILLILLFSLDSISDDKTQELTPDSRERQYTPDSGKRQHTPGSEQRALLSKETQADEESEDEERWARLGPEYSPENIFTIEAPPGKLGVVIDTPDAGPAIVHSLKENSVLVGLVRPGDRVLAVDDEDVTFLAPVNISRLITRKSRQEARTFTLMRTSSRVQ